MSLLHPSNSPSKHTTSSLYKLLETYSVFTIRRLQRHKYNLRYNRKPSLARTNSSLLRRHAQSLSSETLSSHEHIQTSGHDTALSSYNHTGHLFSRLTSQNPSVFSSDEHLLNIDIFTDEYSTPPTPNRVHYQQIVNDILVSSPCKEPRFFYFACDKMNSNVQSSQRRQKNFIA